MHKNYLFDLDGTLLPMDLKKFIDLYISSFCKKFASVTELDAKTLSDGLWAGSMAMGRNDGACLNREVFWRTLNSICNRDMRVFEDMFDEYYRTEFADAKKATSVTPYAQKCIDVLKAQNKKLIVATNPIFPKASTYTRIRWAGLDPNDFEYITVYDNCSFCKPNLNYYEEICSVCGIIPEESIMIGNDVDEDMCASKLGFDTFLITDCLINRREKDISRYKSGSFRDLYDYLLF